ncbi:MAG: protein kinase [Ilumatobacteraceae bacterium]
MRAEPGVLLGSRYVLVRRIAVGGMGEVWEATDSLLDRGVAVKILKEEFRTASTFLARFRAEARHAGQLSHRGIATVYDYGETEDLAFLVMELVRGRPLSELLIEQPALSTVTKLSILDQAAQGLHAAHEAGVVHRDVKPGNLMVRDDGVVKVTDFGIARALTSAPLTEHGQMLGTPAYVSPEQATGGQVTRASDIYSLAVVAYEMFAGHAPFERDTPVALALAHVHDTPPPLPSSVPRRVAELIESALSKDPSSRPPSAGHFAEQLRQEMSATKSDQPSAVVADRDLGLTAPAIVSPSSSGAVVGRTSTLVTPVGARGGGQRNPSVTAAIAFAGLLIVLGAIVWTATRPSGVDEARREPSLATTISAPTVVTQTSPPTQPATTLPATTLPATTLPATTLPATTVPAQTVPLPIVPLPTQPPPAPAAAIDVNGIGENEAAAFVVDYYEQVAAGDYGTTWELLSPGFRDARNLTFERYVSYWENTTLKLSDLRVVAGPGGDESRVIFDARYDTGSRIVNETDEITLRRATDGRVIITKQRTV